MPDEQLHSPLTLFPGRKARRYFTPQSLQCALHPPAVMMNAGSFKVHMNGVFARIRTNPLEQLIDFGVGSSLRHKRKQVRPVDGYLLQFMP